MILDAVRRNTYWLPFALVLAPNVFAHPLVAVQEDAVALPAPVLPPRPIGTSEVNVSEFMTVDLLAQNAYLTDILQKLSIQARRNIVPSGNIERLITASMHGVPFYEALSGFLEPNGLGYLERGEFIFIHTKTELESLDVGGFGGVSKLINLNYLRAADAQEYITPMLSPKGSIAITRDLTDDGPAEAGGGSGAGSVQDSSIYTPTKDEFDLRNAVIVNDLPDRIERIEKFLLELDVRPAQILLEASVIQTSLTEDTAFGVDFALLGDESFVDFFRAPVGSQTLDFKNVTDANGVTAPIVPATPSSFDTFVVSNPGNTGAGKAGFRAGFVGDIGVFLRALDQVTDVTLLSNPKVMTLNRQRSKVFVGDRVGFFETTTVENQVIQTLKTIDTGIVLDIRTFLLSDDRVRLELSPKISQVTFRKVAAPGGGLQDIPDEAVQTVTADILIPVGHTAVIGGLFREDTIRSRNQVPFFGDIPLIGALFRGNDDNLKQLEIIFLIKPTVLDDKTLSHHGELALQRLEDTRVGSRLGLLPWSRENQSARINLEAQSLIASGELDKARWKLRRSLGMLPQQPDVIRAIEKLENQELWVRNLSLINQMIDEEFEARGEELSALRYKLNGDLIEEEAEEEAEDVSVEGEMNEGDVDPVESDPVESDPGEGDSDEGAE
ncbi:MAG: type IV pilus assembly protein PilQ [Planctomycetota bacterium]|jgi:type IV pilus assembly protein PilQ